MNRRAYSPAGDLLYGSKAIAEHLGVRPRAALYLVETGRLPVFREGRIICARRSRLDAWLVEQEATARPAPASSSHA